MGGANQKFPIRARITAVICKVPVPRATNLRMKRFFTTLFTLGLAWPLAAQSPAKNLLNLDKQGVAIQGYDPVAFFTGHKPVKGSATFPARYHGAIYLFATKEDQETFKNDPAKYEPEFGGYCAYGVSRGKLVGIEVEAFQIVGGRLLLQYSKSVRDSFNKDAAGNLSKARDRWPALVEKSGQ